MRLAAVTMVTHAAGHGFQMFGLRFGPGPADLLLRVCGRQVGLVFAWLPQDGREGGTGG